METLLHTGEASLSGKAVAPDAVSPDGTPRTGPHTGPSASPHPPVTTVPSVQRHPGTSTIHLCSLESPGGGSALPGSPAPVGQAGDSPECQPLPAAPAAAAARTPAFAGTPAFSGPGLGPGSSRAASGQPPPAGLRDGVSLAFPPPAAPSACERVVSTVPFRVLVLLGRRPTGETVRSLSRPLVMPRLVLHEGLSPSSCGDPDRSLCVTDICARCADEGMGLQGLPPPSPRAWAPGLPSPGTPSGAGA